MARPSGIGIEKSANIATPKNTRGQLRRAVTRRALAGCMALTLAGLGGCSGLDNTAASASGTELLTAAQWFVILDVVSIVNTDKTIVDHIVSSATGQDCSTVEYSKGNPYCKQPPKPEPPLYCYRSLAAVSCYSTPDPYNTGARPLDWPPTRSKSL